MTIFGSIYPPHKKPPLIKKENLGNQICVTINLDADGGTITPLIKKRCLVKPPRILKKCGFVVDRRSIDLLTKYIRKASEI